MDGDVHHGVRGAKASLCPLGCERECRCPAPARAVGLLPPLPPAHCTLCTWMSRHRPSLRGDKGSSDAQLCLCTKARWRRSSPARVPEGVLGGPGGGAWGPTAAAKPMEAASLLAAQRGPSEKAPAGNASCGRTSPGRVVSGFKCKKQQEQRDGGAAPGALVLGHSGATREPRHAHKVTTMGEVAPQPRSTRQETPARRRGGEGRGGARTPPRPPTAHTPPRGQHSGGQLQGDVSLAHPPGLWSSTVASGDALPCATAPPRLPVLLKRSRRHG